MAATFRREDGQPRQRNPGFERPQALQQQLQRLELDPIRQAGKWRDSLAEIPSHFGRLVYLSRLLDREGTHCETDLLTDKPGVEASSAQIEEAHRLCFAEWLNFSLATQAADLDRYASSVALCEETAIEFWAHLGPYRNLVPTEADEAERQLFVSDLETIFALMPTRSDPNQSGGRLSRS